MDIAFRIKYAPAFRADVLNVVSYLEDYPQKAIRIFEKIDRKLLLLPQMPEMYPVYEDFPYFRKITVEDYLVFYTVNDKDSLIEIHRLIYGGMDIKSLLDESDK